MDEFLIRLIRAGYYVVFAQGHNEIRVSAYKQGNFGTNAKQTAVVTGQNFTDCLALLSDKLT